jgi:hypothetical protein
MFDVGPLLVKNVQQPGSFSSRARILYRREGYYSLQDSQMKN